MPEKPRIETIDKELPSEYADRLGIYYTKQVNIKHKKNAGQFFTPLPIAHLMASFCSISSTEIRVLDPGCGTAVLTCSLLEHLTQNNHNIQKIDLVAYETDSGLIGYCQKSIEYLGLWLNTKGIGFSYTIHSHDFVIDNAKALKAGHQTESNFDFIISNPPYFKLSKDDEKTIAAQELVSGQPNIYSLFMGIAAKLLKNNGQLVFITPRSFASGNYFKAFRELFFSTVQIDRVHLFDSRKATFSRDSVLQETVIIKAIKEDLNHLKQVTVSSSTGIKDIEESKQRHFPSWKLIDLTTKEKILHLPTNEKEVAILNLVSSWENILMDYSIQISTGPVVSFRAWDYIQDNYENGTVFLAPLYWLHNVNKMALKWPTPLKNKGQYIRIEERSKSILIPNKDYILLRRFSTKDDKSRLIAAPYYRDYANADYIGVENKVNYIYRKGGHLERNELSGLCAVLNCELFDTYFQIFNGNVNVSATELRQMKFPSLIAIQSIGDKIILSNDYSMNNINAIVNEYFELETILNLR